MTKLLGPKDLFEEVEFQEVLSPLVEPASDQDLMAISGFLNDLGLANNRPTTIRKIVVLLSSLLMQSMRLESRRERRGEPMMIGFPHDEVYWRKRSEVGYKAAVKLRAALLNKGWLTHKVDAKINLFEETGNCNGYLISDFVPDYARGLQFKSTELVYAASTSSSDKKLTDKETDARVKALWARWKQHPLVLGDQTMFTASRRFNNDALTRGGRFYAQWTNMRKVERLKATIDGLPIAEVDVSGMNLTLLCSISGEVPFKSRFKDAYECGWKDRGEVKAIVNETIGAGHPRHYTMGKLCRDAGLNQEQFKFIRKNYIAPKFKCLQILKKQQLDSLTLAFHESEIIMRVVERMTIPIFILHDCLICQQGFEADVGNKLQMIYINYCKEQGWTPIAPAYSIDRDGEETLFGSGYTV